MSEQQAPYRIEGRPATIFRAAKNKDNPYVMIDRRPIDNKNLSFKAKGILTYLLSRPDGWEVNLVDLANRSTDGLASIKSGVKELKDAGHLKHAGTRKASGQFDTVIWEVYEVPQVGNQPTDTPDMVVSPQVEKPQVENPQADIRIQVLSTVSNKEISSKAAAVFKTYTSEIGVLTANRADSINDLLDHNVPPEWIIDALEIASKQNHRSWAYASAILKRWAVDGKGDKPKHTEPEYRTLNYE